jgi:hypothetical protein
MQIALFDKQLMKHAHATTRQRNMICSADWQ